MSAFTWPTFLVPGAGKSETILGWPIPEKDVGEFASCQSNCISGSPNGRHRSRETSDLFLTNGSMAGEIP